MCWAAPEAGPGQFVNEENWWAPAQHSEVSVCHQQRHWNSAFPSSSSISTVSFVPFQLNLEHFHPKAAVSFLPGEILSATLGWLAQNPISCITPNVVAAGIPPGDLAHPCAAVHPCPELDVPLLPFHSWSCTRIPLGWAFPCTQESPSQP